MSALLLLLCDGSDRHGLCGQRLVYGHDGRGHDVTAARAWAATQGWAYRDGQDRCPKHGGRTRPRLRLDIPAPAAAAVRSAS